MKQGILILIIVYVVVTQAFRTLTIPRWSCPLTSSFHRENGRSLTSSKQDRNVVRRQMFELHAKQNLKSKSKEINGNTSEKQGKSLFQGKEADALREIDLALNNSNEEDDAEEEEDDHEEGVLTYKDFAVVLDESDYRLHFNSLANTQKSDPRDNDQPTITFTQFQSYPKLQTDLINTRKITPGDIEDTWTQVVGDDHPSPLTLTLTYDESFQVLSMLYDFHDIDKEFSFRETFEEIIVSKENQKQLKSLGMTGDSIEKMKLSSIIIPDSLPERKKHVQYGLLTYQAFLKWEDIQEILTDEVLTREEIDDLWKQTKAAKVFNTANPFLKSITGDGDDSKGKKKAGAKKVVVDKIKLTDVLDVEEFLYLNRLIDDVFDTRELEKEEAALKAQATDANPDYDDDAEEDEDEEYDDDTDEVYEGEDIEWDKLWEPSFDISPIYDDKTVEELKNEYLSLFPAEAKSESKGKTKKSSSDSLPLLTYDQFVAWGDIQEIIQDKLLSEKEVKQVWKEALKHRSEFIKGEKKSKKGGKGKEISDESIKSAVKDNDSINFDLFLRANARIEYLLADKEEEAEEQDNRAVDEEDNDDDEEGEEDSTAFYREQYVELTKTLKKSTLSLSDITEWEEVKELVEDGVLSEKQIKQLYDTLPKVGKGSAAGISVDSFIMLNNMIDVLIDTKEAEKEEETAATQGKGKSKKATTTASTPAVLSSEENTVYRMPTKDQELKPTFSSKNAAVSTFSRTGNERSSSSFFLDDDSETSSVNRNMLDEIEAKLKATAVDASKPMSTKSKATELSATEKGELSEEDFEMLQILDQADNLLNTGSFASFDQLIGDTDDERLETIRNIEKEKKTLQGIPGGGLGLGGIAKKNEVVEEIINRILTLGRSQERCGIEIKRAYEQSKEPKEPTSAAASTINDVNTKDYEAVDREFNYLLQLLSDKSPKLGKEKTIQQINTLLNGKWDLLYTNSDMFYFYNGLSGMINLLPGSKLLSLEIEFQSDGYLSETNIQEKVMNTLLPNKPVFPITMTGTYEIVKEISFMTNDLSILFRHYPKDVTVTKLKYQAEDTWKSLRAIALNEIVFIDEKCLIFRNAGALRIFFILQRKQE